MSKKIVVITGSPPKDGNSFAMTDAFIRAAQAKGHTVTRFDAAMMKIGGCHACETCFKTGKACSFDDDFNLIAPAVLEADALVFTMPVYWYSIPAQIKGVIDRLYSLVVGGKDIAGKEIKSGENMFSIETVAAKTTSYSKVKWLNSSGQPAAAPLVLRTADGKYVKMRFSDYNRQDGTIKLKYVYAPDGSLKLE